VQIQPYVTFDGKCAEAFKTYQKILGGKLEMMKNGESPVADQTPADQRDRILHAKLDLGDAVLMGSDAPPQYFTQPGGFTVSIGLKDTAEGERIFRALAEGGSVKMPFAKTFWAERFGMCVDRFGIPWMVNCEGDHH
jgi:PhnB protein